MTEIVNIKEDGIHKRLSTRERILIKVLFFVISVLAIHKYDHQLKEFFNDIIKEIDND